MTNEGIILQEALEVALGDVPAEVFERIKSTVDGEANISVSEWVSLDDNGNYCGCLLFDGYTADQDKAASAYDYLRNEEDTDLEAAMILSDFYGIEITKDNDDWAMKLVVAYDNWANQLDAEYEELYSEGGFLTDEGRIELRRLFTIEARRRAAA